MIAHEAIRATQYAISSDNDTLEIKYKGIRQHFNRGEANEQNTRARASSL